METGTSNNNMRAKGKKSDKGRRVWNEREEEVLLQALKDAISGGFKSENGFRCGYLVFLENAMKKVFPETDIRGNPHINSKIHVWKRTHGTLLTILSKSGIGWNETTKKIEATDEAWDAFVKIDNTVRAMRYKSWPYYNDWCEIFGVDRATGEHVESFADVVQEVLNKTDVVQEVLNTNNDGVPDMEVKLEDLFRAVEGAGESISVTNPISIDSPSIQKSQSKKRKRLIEGDNAIVEAINNFTERTNATLSDGFKCVGHDPTVVNATKDVFDALGMLPELTVEDREIAAEILVEKPNKLSLFFSLPPDSRLRMIWRLLN